jgi:nucleoside-diphosphate-sugar epimerase
MKETSRPTNDRQGGERFLITGALGCIGSWTLRALAREGTPVVALDLSTDLRRLALIGDEADLRHVRVVRGDITRLADVEAALDEHDITHVIHLAALQVPAARADPPLGALVNVVGTVNVFEAVRRRADRIRGLAYTSSIGVFDAADGDPIDGLLRPDAVAHPQTHYGVYKQANEGTARVYWLENGLASVGVRPMTVYGPGRDQGLTSGPTRAIASALMGRPFTIGFGGRTLFQFGPDVASALLAAARSGLEGAPVFNLGGTAASLDEFIDLVEEAVPEARGLLTHAEPGLPFPDRIDDAGSDALGALSWTPLAEGIRQTAQAFNRRRSQGPVVPEEFGLEPAPTLA